MAVFNRTPSEPEVRGVGDLIQKCREARDLMSRSNPHRALLHECVQALTQLANRLAVFEPEDPVASEMKEHETPH